MLRKVAFYLKRQREILIERVPVMNDVIEKFIQMENAIDKARASTIHLQPAIGASQKVVTRIAFEEVVLKLSSAAMAAGADSKQKKVVKYASAAGLKKLSAAALCREFVSAMTQVKKMRNPDRYGLSKDFLADAQGYYKEFNAIKNVPAKKKKERADFNKGIDAAVSDCLAFLTKKIDPLMRIASLGDREMTQTYKGIRIVLPRGKGRPSDKEIAYRKSRSRKDKKTE